jgi:hypothetical protein
MANITHDHIVVLQEALSTFVELGCDDKKTLDTIDDLWHIIYESYLQGVDNVYTGN